MDSRRQKTVTLPSGVRVRVLFSKNTTLAKAGRLARLRITQLTPSGAYGTWREVERIGNWSTQDRDHIFLVNKIWRDNPEQKYFPPDGGPVAPASGR